MSGKTKYYRLNAILKEKAQYNVIFGERSNGKTYAVLERALEIFVETGQQLAIIRRWQDDFKQKRGATMFDNHVANGLVTKLTDGEWNNVYYYSGRWYLSKWDDTNEKRITMETPFAYAFSISAMEHDKSSSYPNVTTIVFDEFLTRRAYLPDEFIMFMNVLSTIIRDRTNVTIFMLGNTVNKYSPYFAEMGLTNVPNMEPGDIDVYSYGDSALKVAVEYATAGKKGKKSDSYFAFDNPKLNMITNGAWEIDIYPHCPVKYKPKEVLFTYFICFNRTTLQCEIVLHDNLLFTFIHKKTTPLKNEDEDLIYSPEYRPNPNWRRKITKPSTRVESRVYDFFRNDKVFYQDNEIGEVVRNYLQWSTSGN